MIPVLLHDHLDALVGENAHIFLRTKRCNEAAAENSLGENLGHIEILILHGLHQSIALKHLLFERTLTLKRVHFHGAILANRFRLLEVLGLDRVHRIDMNVVAESHTRIQERKDGRD